MAHAAERSRMFWSSCPAPDGRILTAAATERGLCYVGLHSEPHDGGERRVRGVRTGKNFASAERNDEALRPYLEQLTEYLRGERTAFDLPLDVQGTPFQLAVWEAVRSIPYGQTRTYSDIARQIGKPASVRAVGAAVGANPVLLVVPCHRVVGKDGSLTGFREGLDLKERLLRLESAPRSSAGAEAGRHFRSSESAAG